MTASATYAQVSARLAVIPNILRARADDIARLERHGSLNGEAEARVLKAAKRLEKVVAELEKSLA